MLTRLTYGEWDNGSWWIMAQYPKQAGVKLSKSDDGQGGPWFPISSWSSKEAAQEADKFYRSQP